MLRYLFIMATLLACRVSGAAESFPVIAQDSGARMVEVASGVYAIIHDDATDEWPHGNTGVVVSEDSVLVVDSTYLPSRARADIALIRTVTDNAVRYLVNTHWHFDHNNGAVAYREAFPGLTVVSERQTRDFIDLNATWWMKMSTAPDSARLKSLRDLQQQLSRGSDAQGKRLSDDAKRKLTNNVRHRQNELQELAAMQVVVPDLVFDGHLALDFGGRRIELQDQGPGNSPHDVTVYLPQERVLFTGDLLVQAPVPYFSASWPVPWSEVLRRLEQVDIAVLVPGHGPVMHDHAYTQQVRRLLEGVTSRVVTMARDGKTLEQIQSSTDLEDLRTGVAPWMGPEVDEDWKATTEILIERVWRGVRGQSG